MRNRDVTSFPPTNAAPIAFAAKERYSGIARAIQILSARRHSPVAIARNALVEPHSAHSRPYSRFDSHMGVTAAIARSGSTAGAITLAAVGTVTTNQTISSAVLRSREMRGVRDRGSIPASCGSRRSRVPAGRIGPNVRSLMLRYDAPRAARAPDLLSRARQ